MISIILFPTCCTKPTTVRKCISGGLCSALRSGNKKVYCRNSLAVQWLGLGTFTAGGLSSIPGLGAKIPQSTWCSQKKKSLLHWIFCSESQILIYSENLLSAFQLCLVFYSFFSLVKNYTYSFVPLS